MDKYTSFAKLYDSFSFDAPAKDWAEYISSLLVQNGVMRGAGLIDIGCGTGKITLELYKKGYNITAVDSSPEMLEVAAFRFAEAGAHIQTVNQDIRKMEIHRKADGVLCVNDVVNYLTEKNDVLKAFGRIYDMLGDGGVFLFDISSKRKLKSLHGKQFFEEKDEGLYILSSEYDKKCDTLTMDISLYSHFEDNLYEKSLETHIQKAHTVSGLVELLAQSGFSQMKAYECFSFSGPKDDSQRIQFLAVK